MNFPLTQCKALFWRGRACTFALTILVMAAALPALAVAPSTADLWDISQGITVTRTSGIYPGFDARDVFGATLSSIVPGSVIFNDGRPEGFVHFMEWQTPSPITMRSFRLFAHGDMPIYNSQREFSEFRLKAKRSASSDYELLYTFTPTHPYTFIDVATLKLIEANVPEITAQFFRAEFVQFNAHRGFDGPRVLELEAFASTIPSSTDGSQYTVVWTLAGTGIPDYRDGPGSGASFSAPNSGFIGLDQSFYLADTGNNRIRRVDRAEGHVTTVAGSGATGFADGPALLAVFDHPLAVCGNRSGSAAFIVDSGNNRIRKLTLESDSRVSTFAGSGVRGYADGAAEVAQFDLPTDIVINEQGDLFISDFNNHTIRKVSNGSVSTFVGHGTPGFEDGIGSRAGLNQPAGLALDKAGNLFVTEWGSHRVRKITPDGVVTTLAGSVFPGLVDGNGVQARFFEPDGIAVDALGVLYVTEHGNHTIRRISPQGDVSTIAGNGSPGFFDGIAAGPQFNAPGGIVVDATGALIVSDTGNHRIREIQFVTAPQVTIVVPFSNIALGGWLELSAVVRVPGQYTYQWKFNGAPIPGATSAVLTLINAQLAQSGNYSVVVKSAVASTESPALAVTVGQSAGPVIGFARGLPEGYTPGVALTVRLERSAVGPSGSGAYAIEESPPENWTVTNISDGGSFDAVNHKIKFGPFFDLAHTAFTYEATPPVAEIGVKTFKGIVSVDGKDQAISGTSTLAPFPLHPADLNPADRRLSVNEVTAYGAAWRTSKSWPIGPNPIPIDYLTRAGLLWKNGEYYRFDANLIPPQCWVGRSPVQLTSLRESALPSVSSAKFSLAPASTVSDQVLVRITVDPALASVYAVASEMPGGLVVTAVSDSGTYDPLTHQVRWGPFFDSIGRELTVQANVGSATVFPLRFDGTASFDGVSKVISDAALVRQPPRRIALSLLSNQELRLSLGQPDGRDYEIQASTDLQNWAPLSIVKNSDGILRLNNPGFALFPMKFYRAFALPP